MKVIVTFTVSLPITLKKEGKYTISCCPILDIWSQGVTDQEAEKNLKEAVRLFLTDCFERGTLEKVLKDCGFVAVKKFPQHIPRPSSQKEIEVPLPFIIDQQLARCHG
jgi:predicted RNase H-like HicB family nuclease